MGWPRWVGRGVTAVALAGALSLAGATAQAEDLAWRPTDSGIDWGRAQVTAVPDTEVPGCGGSRWYWESEIGVVTLIVLDCDAPDTAAGVVRNLVQNLDYTPAPEVAPVFGPGYDVALTAASGNLDRYWTQASRYVGVGTTCGVRDCVEATARYATQLAALFGEKINPVWPRPASGPVTGFTPSGGPWMLTADHALPSAQLRVTACAEAMERQWRDTTGHIAMVSTVECGTEELAGRAWSDLWVNLQERVAEGGVLGQGVDRATGWQVDADRIGYGRAWIQGTNYMYLHRICRAVDWESCRDSTAVDAVALAGLMPGEPVFDRRPVNTAIRIVVLLFVVPLASVAVLVLPRALWRHGRERGWAVGPQHPAFTVLDGEVRQARRGRTLRSLTAGLLVVVIYVAGAFGWSSAGNVLLFGLWVFLGPLVLVPLVTGVLRLVWPQHRLMRVARGPRGPATLLSVAGSVLRASSGVLALLALAGYIVCSALYILLSSQTPQLTEQAVSQMLAAPDLLTNLLGTVYGFVFGLDQRGLIWVLFLAVVVGPMTLAYLLDRVGQRLGQRSLAAVLTADARPHLLYLRGFEEDELRISPSLTRTSFLQWLTPFGRPRFEEVMVRYLARFGPVIAIAGEHGRALPSLGAAKASFADDQWQAKVHDWMGSALAVVVAATPAQVRDGLMWELVQLADLERRPRVMLVVAPWPREQLGSRWQGFLSAAARLPLFMPLAARPFPPAVQVMTYTTDAGWRGYGASRRWDWSYAATLVAAVEDAAPTWDRDRLAEQGHRITPDPL